ncbi:MAG: phage portal protein [Bacteroides sp.]|nr:phage portal protein [Bacteroides sp.]
MKVDDILSLKSVTDQLYLLKHNCNDLNAGDIQKLRDFYDNKHPILNDPEKNPYWITQMELDATGKSVEVQHEMKHSKLCIPYAQQIITNKVAFLYGKPIDLLLEEDRGNQAKLDAFNRFQDIWNKDIRMMSILREATMVCGIETRAAIQFMYDKESKKIKAKVLSLKEGYRIYRHKDEFTKVDSVVVEYKHDVIKDGKLQKNVSETEIWTKDGLIRYTNGDYNNPQKEENKYMKNKKLLFVYLEQPEAEFQSVMPIIDKQDYARSQHSDVNVKIGSPSLVVNGQIKTKPLCNATVNIYEITPSDDFDSDKTSTADMKYLQLDSAPESVKLEMINNEKDIYRFTYPDLSTLLSDSNFGNLSGKSIQLMFTQAFVKLAEEKVVHDDVISRSISVIKNLAADLYTEYPAMRDLKIGFNYNSILPSTDSDIVTMLVAAVTSGITSVKNAVKMLSFNTPETYREIQEEKLKTALEEAGINTDEGDSSGDIKGSNGNVEEDIDTDSNDRNAEGVNS